MSRGHALWATEQREAHPRPRGLWLGPGALPVPATQGPSKLAPFKLAFSCQSSMLSYSRDPEPWCLWGTGLELTGADLTRAQVLGGPVSPGFGRPEWLLCLEMLPSGNTKPARPSPPRVPRAALPVLGSSPDCPSWVPKYTGITQDHWVLVGGQWLSSSCPRLSAGFAVSVQTREDQATALQGWGLPGALLHHSSDCAGWGQ